MSCWLEVTPDGATKVDAYVPTTRTINYIRKRCHLSDALLNMLTFVHCFRGDLKPQGYQGQYWNVREGEIVLDCSLRGHILAATLAHELYHAFAHKYALHKDPLEEEFEAHRISREVRGTNRYNPINWIDDQYLWAWVVKKYGTGVCHGR